MFTSPDNACINVDRELLLNEIRLEKCGGYVAYLGGSKGDTGVCGGAREVLKVLTGVLDLDLVRDILKVVTEHCFCTFVTSPDVVIPGV